MIRARVLPPVILLLALAGCAATHQEGTATESLATAVARGPSLTIGTGRMQPVLARTEFGSQVAEAVRTHPSLSAGAARIAAAEAQLSGERSVLRPQVSLGADAGITIAGPGGSQGTPFVQVRQLLFDGGATRSRSQAARAQLVRSYSDRIGTAAGLALNAVEAAHMLAHERRLLALAERNLAIHREFLSQIEDRLDAGAGTEADLLTARSRLADATTRAVTARGRLERAEAGWREVYGTPPATARAPAAAPPLPSGNDAALIAASPRLQSLAAETDAARAALAAAEAGRLPSVSVALSGRRRPGGGAGATADLAVRYDLTTGGQREAAIRTAEARVAELEAERDDLSRQIARALEFVRADQRTGRERLNAARSALAANEASVDSAREQFAVGRRSITQLLDAQRDFVFAAEALAQAELELALSGYAALALTGDILDVFGIVLPTAIPDGQNAVVGGQGAMND